MSRSKTKHRPSSAPSAPKAASVGILVLGMHRSGTSAVTRVLNLLGADLGRRLLPAVEGVNDAGFWEHADAVALDDKLLHWHDRPWHSVQPMPVDTIGRDLLAQARADIGALIKRDFADSALWAVKDPRMSLLAPVWIRALHEAGVSPRVLVAVRHPDEVAASLRRRDAITRAHADLLWGTYFIDAVRASAGLPRAVCDYAGLLADWRGSIARLGDGLGVAWPVPNEEAGPTIDGFLRPEQRRHHAGATDPHDEDALHASVLALYAIAVDIADGRAEWDALDPAIDRFERIRRQAAPHVQELLDHVWAHADRARLVEAQLARLRAAGGGVRAVADSTGATLDRNAPAGSDLADDASDITELRRRLDVAEARVAEKEARIAAMSPQLLRLEAAQAELHGHASALEAAREELRRKVEVAESGLHRLQQVIDEKEARLIAARDNAGRADAAMAALQRHAQALETARGDAVSRIQQLEAQLSVATATRPHLEQLLEERKARLGQFGERLSGCEAALRTARGETAALQRAMDTAQAADRSAAAAVEARHAAESGALSAALEAAEARHAEERLRMTSLVEAADTRHAVERGQLVAAMEAATSQHAAALRDAKARFAQDRRAFDTALDAAEARNAEVLRQLEARRNDLEVLRNSRSWRITAPLRAVLAWMRPGR